MKEYAGLTTRNYLIVADNKVVTGIAEISLATADIELVLKDNNIVQQLAVEKCVFAVTPDQLDKLLDVLGLLKEQLTKIQGDGEAARSVASEPEIPNTNDSGC